MRCLDYARHGKRSVKSYGLRVMRKDKKIVFCHLDWSDTYFLVISTGAKRNGEISSLTNDEVEQEE